MVYVYVEQNLELCRDFQGLSFDRVIMYTAITNKSLYLLELPELCNGDSVDDWDFSSKNSSRSTFSIISFMTLSLIPPVFKSHSCSLTDDNVFWTFVIVIVEWIVNLQLVVDYSYQFYDNRSLFSINESNSLFFWWVYWHKIVRFTDL